MVSGQEMGQSKRVVVSHNVDRALKEGRCVCFTRNVSRDKLKLLKNGVPASFYLYSVIARIHKYRYF